MDRHLASRPEDRQVACARMEIRDALAATCQSAEPVFAGVSTGQLGDPTPCPAFDVRALANHVLAVLDHTSAALDGGAKPAPDVDIVGSDPGAAFAVTSKRYLAAWQPDDALDRTLAMPWGEGAATNTALMTMADLLTHTWDLAKATGQRYEMPEEPAHMAFDWTRGMLKPEFRSEGPEAAFGPEVPVPESAPITDRLVGWLGRQP